MDEKIIDHKEIEEKPVEYASPKKGEGLTSLEIEALDGLRTVEVGLTAEQVNLQIDDKERTRILRKVDYRLVPILGVLYL